MYRVDGVTVRGNDRQRRGFGAAENEYRPSAIQVPAIWLYLLSRYAFADSTVNGKKEKEKGQDSAISNASVYTIAGCLVSGDLEGVWWRQVTSPMMFLLRVNHYSSELASYLSTEHSDSWTIAKPPNSFQTTKRWFYQSGTTPQRVRWSPCSIELEHRPCYGPCRQARARAMCGVTRPQPGPAACNRMAILGHTGFSANIFKTCVSQATTPALLLTG